MKLDINYRVATSDGKSWYFDEVQDAVAFYDEKAAEIKAQHKHNNERTNDHWPIYDRTLTSYNGAFEKFFYLHIQTMWGAVVLK